MRGGLMLEQEAMIEKVCELCEGDERVVAALMYGSFTLGQGDYFSDIEFYLFFDDEVLDTLEEEAWVSQIAPLELYYLNEYGSGTPRASPLPVLQPDQLDSYGHQPSKERRVRPR